ncbi:MAG: UbiA family prenyltransferase [Thermoplasmataceae archaeon]
MKISEFVKISNSSVTLIVLIVTVSSFLANPNSTTNLIILLPLIGAGYLMSMSAVLFNNIYDRDVDGLMDRTSFRVPLVNENLAKLKFISILSFALGFAVAFLLINYLATIFLTLGLLSYSVLYTVILKRKTVLNIVIGSIAGSFASLSGWMS